METEQNNFIDEMIKDFYSSIVSYGYLDVKRAIEIYNEVGKSGDDLAEDVRRWAEDTGTDLNEMDVCFIAYETILQEARNKIQEVLEFDFLNEGKGTGIYTYGNYICSSYDNTEDLKNYILKKLKKASKEQKQELHEDKITEWFLNEIEVFN